MDVGIKKVQLGGRKYLSYIYIIRMDIPNHLRVSGHDKEKFTLNVFCSPVEKKSKGWLVSFFFWKQGTLN